jgi:hypothetical protein
MPVEGFVRAVGLEPVPEVVDIVLVADLTTKCSERVEEGGPPGPRRLVVGGGKKSRLGGS